jgi:hypothetical protein
MRNRHVDPHFRHVGIADAAKPPDPLHEPGCRQG